MRAHVCAYDIGQWLGVASGAGSFGGANCCVWCWAVVEGVSCQQVLQQFVHCSCHITPAWFSSLSRNSVSSPFIHSFGLHFCGFLLESLADAEWKSESWGLVLAPLGLSKMGQWDPTLAESHPALPCHDRQGEHGEQKQHPQV